MIENNRKAKRGPPRRDETCYQVLSDIVIPAGTILRDVGKGNFGAPVGLDGDFLISPKPGKIPSGFKRVVA